MREKSPNHFTKKLNKKQKELAKKMRGNALSWLKENFPAAFDDTHSIHPLKIGIMQDILRYANEANLVGISKSKLREAVVTHTRRVDYLACLKAREMRIDLQGNPTAIVTEEEVQQAADKLKKIVEKQIKMSQNKEPKADGSSQKTPYYTYPEHNLQPLISPSKETTIVVKHKTTKPFDPSAVARLKAKLGLVEK